MDGAHRRNQGGECRLPECCNGGRKVSDLYDMIYPNANAALAVRSPLVIATQKKVRLIIAHAVRTGRNFDEILRVVDWLQLTPQPNLEDAGPKKARRCSNAVQLRAERHFCF